MHGQLDFPGGSVVKESACNAGDTEDMGSIPGSGRYPTGGHGHPLHYYCLENPVDRGTWWATVHRVAKSLKWLSTYTQLINFQQFSGQESLFKQMILEQLGRHF